MTQASPPGSVSQDHRGQINPSASARTRPTWRNIRSGTQRPSRHRPGFHRAVHRTLWQRQCSAAEPSGNSPQTQWSAPARQRIPAVPFQRIAAATEKRATHSKALQCQRVCNQKINLRGPGFSAPLKLTPRSTSFLWGSFLGKLE